MTWEYLAGFFDGEGTTGIYAHNTAHYQPRWGITQSETRGLALLEEIEEFLQTQNIKICPIYKRQSLNPRHAVSYLMQTNNRVSVQRILRGLLPYLRIKREEAEYVLNYIELHPDARRKEFKA